MSNSHRSESTIKRDREEATEDTEEEQRRSIAFELCRLMADVQICQPEPMTIPELDVIKKRREDPDSPLYRNRELIRILYTASHTIIVEKIHGTTKFIVTYRELVYSDENDFVPLARCYIGTAEECEKSHPGILSQ